MFLYTVFGADLVQAEGLWCQESIHLLFDLLIGLLRVRGQPQVAFCVRCTVSFHVCFQFWDLIQSTRFSRSSRCLPLKWSVQTGRIWRVRTLFPEEDCGPNVCNRENYNYRQAERRRKEHNKAHHWLTGLNWDSPHCRHSFPAFQSAWVGSRVSSDDFTSGEGCWCNLQPRMTQCTLKLDLWKAASVPMPQLVFGKEGHTHLDRAAVSCCTRR